MTGVQTCALPIYRIEELIRDNGVREVVVGLPLCMNGSTGERAKDSTRFAEKLQERTGVTVRMWDERFSTREAENIMKEAAVPSRQRRGHLDKLAAQIILQSYLERSGD